MFKKPFGGNKRFGGKPSGRSFGGDRKPWDRGSRDGGFDRPAMHPATCAECGQSCQVPFKPNGSKPIYCSNCFGGKRDDAPKKFGERRFDAPRNEYSGEKKMFETECDKCDAVCEVPFRPNGSKPVYCKDCFGANRGNVTERPERNDRPRTDMSSEQLKLINAKLDEILKALAERA